MSCLRRRDCRKKVEKLLKDKGVTAILKINAEVCLHCGERLYAPEVIARFKDVRGKLKEGRIKYFTEIGKTYQAS